VLCVYSLLEHTDVTTSYDNETDVTIMYVLMWPLCPTRLAPVPTPLEQALIQS